MPFISGFSRLRKVEKRETTGILGTRSMGADICLVVSSVNAGCCTKVAALKLPGTNKNVARGIKI